jgi:hypothetical protein
VEVRRERVRALFLTSLLNEDETQGLLEPALALEKLEDLFADTHVKWVI